MLTENRPVTEMDSTSSMQPAPLVNPIHFFVRIFLYLALALVVLPLPLFLAGRDAGLLGELIGAILALSMLLSAGISALVGWSISRRLKRFRQGDFLAHWTYSREEWLAFADSEWEHRRRESRQGPRLGLLLGAFTGLICGGSTAYALSPGVLPLALGALGGLLLLGFLGVLFGWLIARAVRYAGWLTYRRMQTRIGETYIGLDAAYCGECYWSWTMPNFELVKLELAAGSPAVLVFTLRVYMPKGGVALYTYRAPIPEGREQEARWIMQRLVGR